MSKTTYTEPTIGATATAAEVTAIFESLRDATVGDGNLREEGLDDHAFAAGVHLASVERKNLVLNTNNVFTSTSSLALLTSSAVVIPSNDFVKVEVFFELGTRVKANTVDTYGLASLSTGAYLEYQIFQRLDGGSTDPIAVTKRRIGPISSEQYMGWHGSCHTFAHVTGAGESYVFSLKLFVSASTQANIMNPQMLVRHYQGVT